MCASKTTIMNSDYIWVCIYIYACLTPLTKESIEWVDDDETPPLGSELLSLGASEIGV